jgi:hypothetical protein
VKYIRLSMPCAVVVLLAVAGCKSDSWDDQPNNGPLAPPASALASACPLLSADEVGQVFGLTGVQSKEGHKLDIANSSTVMCDYDKGFDFTMSLAVGTISAKGSAADALKAALNNSKGDNVSGLGDAAAYHTPQPIVGQLVVVKKAGGSQFRIVTLTGDPDSKEKFITLAKAVLPKV